MKRVSFSKREQKIFVMMVLAVSGYVLYQWIYLPVKKRTQILQEQIQTKEAELTRNFRTIRRAKVYEKRYKALLDRYKQTVSDEQVMSSMISEIETAARDIDLRITDMKPKHGKTADLYNHFSLSLAIDGALTDIMKFVHTLQSPPQLFHIDELHLSKGVQQSGNLRCQLVLTRTLIP